MGGDSTQIVVRDAVEGDAGAVTATLAAAFAEGPVAEWLIPDPIRRRRVYLAYSRVLYRQAVGTGLIHTTTRQDGAAVWFRYAPGAEHPGGDLGQDDLVAVLGDAAGRLADLDAAMARRVPGRRHHHLAFLGVAPRWQRQGIGSALLAHHHRHLDATRTGAFLVATSPGSRRLYARHGYTTREAFDLPAGPTLWAMWREPRAANGGHGPGRLTGRI